MLKPVEKKSLSDAVFEQLRDEIVSGRMAPGSALPAERALCEMLNVNRGAVREALKKLEQARLVSIQQGGATRVLDFRETAGLDLIAVLITDTRGQIVPAVVRGVMELRSALAVDIARRCAQRDPAAGEDLFNICKAMHDSESDLEALLQHNVAFWTRLVDGAGNVAYRLAYNTVRDLLEELPAVFASLLANETTDVDTHERIARAVADADVDDAEFYTRDLISRGERRVAELAGLLEPQGHDQDSDIAGERK